MQGEPPFASESLGTRFSRETGNLATRRCLVVRRLQRAMGVFPILQASDCTESTAHVVTDLDAALST